MFSSGNSAVRWRTTRFGSCLALAALLAVLTAAYWHGPHDHEHGEHEDQEQSCPVCVAVHTPTSDALPEGAPCVLRLELVAVVVVDDELTAAVLPLRVGWARGPPAVGAVV